MNARQLQRKSRRYWTLLAGALAGAVQLGGCGIAGMAGPYPGVPDFVDASSLARPEGPAAAPQVGYRSDEGRYFEIVPRAAAACTGAMLYYVDKGKGIRSAVVKFDDGTMLGNEFVIDAANEEYLVGPITRGNTDCSSGGGFCGGSKLPYSTDGGRTWKRGEASSASDRLSITGTYVYAVGNVPRLADLANGRPSLSDWRYVRETTRPRIEPLDTKFHCTPNGKE